MDNTSRITGEAVAGCKYVTVFSTSREARRELYRSEDVFHSEVVAAVRLKLCMDNSRTTCSSRGSRITMIVTVQVGVLDTLREARDEPRRSVLLLLDIYCHCMFT